MIQRSNRIDKTSPSLHGKMPGILVWCLVTVLGCYGEEDMPLPVASWIFSASNDGSDLSFGGENPVTLEKMTYGPGPCGERDGAVNLPVSDNQVMRVLNPSNKLRFDSQMTFFMHIYYTGHKGPLFEYNKGTDSSSSRKGALFWVWEGETSLKIEKTGVDVHAVNVLKKNAWNKVTAVWDTDSVTIYVDGTLVKKGRGSVDLSSTQEGHIHFGYRPGNTYFLHGCRVACAQFYDQALHQELIANYLSCNTHVPVTDVTWTCGHCADDELCDKVSRECPNGCKKWYINPRCDVYIDLPGTEDIRVDVLSSAESNITWKSDIIISEDLEDYYFYEIVTSVDGHIKADRINHTSEKEIYSMLLAGLTEITEYEIAIYPYRVWNGTQEVGRKSPSFVFKAVCPGTGLALQRAWFVVGALIGALALVICIAGMVKIFKRRSQNTASPSVAIVDTLMKPDAQKTDKRPMNPPISGALNIEEDLDVYKKADEVYEHTDLSEKHDDNNLYETFG